MPPAHLADRLLALLRSVAAQLGVAAAPQAARDLGADLQLVGRAVVRQRLRVGVDGPEIHVLQVGLDHAVERVAAAAAHADDLRVARAYVTERLFGDDASTAL